MIINKVLILIVYRNKYTIWDFFLNEFCEMKNNKQKTPINSFFSSFCFLFSFWEIFIFNFSILFAYVIQASSSLQHPPEAL